MRLLVLLLFAAACSRTALDVEGLDSDGGPAGSCDAGVNVGSTTRTATFEQAGPIVIDPDDDLLLVIGGDTDSAGTVAGVIRGVKLGTGEPVTFTRTGDSNVAIGIGGRAIWDAQNHRVVVLGNSLSFIDPSAPPDLSQVYSITIGGTNAELAELPIFPGGETGDISLAAAIDPVNGKLLVLPETGGVAGPIVTWALDLSSDKWSTFSTDNQSALANMQFVSAAYDAPSRRLIAMGGGQMWGLSLDAPTSWSEIQGTFPPILDDYENVLSGGPSLVWDDDLCAYVVAFTDGYCLYQVWRADIAQSTFTMTALGVSAQLEPTYGRGMGAFDAHRKNFVFGGAYDCEEGDYIADTTDFVPVAP